MKSVINGIPESLQQEASRERERHQQQSAQAPPPLQRDASVPQEIFQGSNLTAFSDGKIFQDNFFILDKYKYRVTILDGENLLLTWICNDPSTFIAFGLLSRRIFVSRSGNMCTTMRA